MACSLSFENKKLFKSKYRQNEFKVVFEKLDEKHRTHFPNTS